MIGLPSEYRFQIENQCGETLKLDLKYRPQKLGSSGQLIYGDWVHYWSQDTDTVATNSYLPIEIDSAGTDIIDNRTDLYLGLEIWYGWQFLDTSGIDANGLVTLRLQSFYRAVQADWIESGRGIILASDLILTDAYVAANDVASDTIML